MYTETIPTVKPSLPHCEINSKIGKDWKAANPFHTLNRLSMCVCVCVFSGTCRQHETSRVGLQDVMPSCRTYTPHDSISDQWNRSAFSGYRGDGQLWPPWVPCQSREWPAWVIYTSPRVSQCHVARKRHITAANHVAAVVTRATVRRTSSWTHIREAALWLWCLSWSYNMYTRRCAWLPRCAGAHRCVLFCLESPFAAVVPGALTRERLMELQV